MGIALALASAVCYGLSDVLGGLMSRRASFVAVALTGQLAALVLIGVTAPWVSRTMPTADGLGWGALSGVGTGIGMLMLFRGMARGTMSVVVPISAMSGVTLPVLVSVLVLGEHPSAAAWIGIGTSIPALWFVSRARGGHTSGGASGALDGLAAGAGIALQYVALAQSGGGSGIWPIAAGRVTAATVILLVALRTGSTLRRASSPRVLAGAATAGGLAAAALVCYLLASQQQLVVVAVVLSSLYPVIPVLIGLTMLGERLARAQLGGLVAAGLAIALITAG